LVYDVFNVADTVSATSGGTFSGGVTMGGALTATAGASSNAVSLQSANFKMTDLTTNAFYRSSTFTPFYTSSGTTVPYESDMLTAASYAVQIGNYVRIGDMVHATLFLRIDESAAAFTNGGAEGEYLAVQGLPFKVKNVTNYYPTTSSIYFGVDSAGGWASYNWVGFGRPDKKDIVLYYSSAGGTVSPVDTVAVFRAAGSTDSEVMLQLTYETDEA